MSIIGQAVAADQVRSGHQGGVDSGNVNPLYIEQYGGEVEHRILKDSFMRQFFKFKTVRGTDTITNDRVGSSSLQKVARGIRPTDNSPTFDNISIKVDTIVLARTNEFVLDAFLSHIDTRKEIGVEHGKEIGKFFDESFLVQGIKACQVTNKDPSGGLFGGWEGSTPTNIIRTAPEGFQGGTVQVLAGAGDELDPDLLELAIQDLCQKVEEKDVEISEAVLLVRPAQYYALLRNSKLISRDFSSMNGDYAKGDVLESCGVRIQKTNRFPKAGDVGATHFLSNAGNGNAYDVTANDQKCVVCLLMPKALLAGETIPLTSDVYFDKKEMQWFIDSYLSFAVTPNRAEMAAGIFSSTVA
jgi:hypothetical protein|tara:strand:+ start:370 stop:1437 length:1068 start_codon:yes stop_codon:yes gene_type:complete